MSSSNLTDEVAKLLNELDAKSISELEEEEIIEYRKKLNPYGRTIEGSDNFLSFSFTNLTEKYLEKLILTSMIGYLNRACDEWHVPDGIPVIPVYDYVQNPSLITSFAENWKPTEKTTRDIEENKRWMQKRVIVKEFLEEMFQYNPDAHVRSAYKPQPHDVERHILDTPAANLAIDELKRINPKFKEDMLAFDRVQKLRNMKESRESAGSKIDESLDHLVGKKLVLPPKEQHYSNINFAEWSAEDRELLTRVCTMIPPVDIFGKYRNYYESNYDKLREAVLHLYCLKPDFDMMINPYQWHKTREDATEFQKKHSSEFVAEVFIAQSGKWNLFAPFAKVRDTVRFFNEKTRVLEEIAEQIVNDSKLGADLMKKRVIKKKKKNIEEDGPDAEAFLNWKAKNSILKDKGATTLTEKDLDPDCPDDAVQVNVFRIAKGGLDLKKDHFFTKAEAPTLPEEKKE